MADDEAIPAYVPLKNFAGLSREEAARWAAIYEFAANGPPGPQQSRYCWRCQEIARAYRRVVDEMDADSELMIGSAIDAALARIKARMSAAEHY